MSKKLSHILLIGVGLFSSTWVMAAVKEYDLTIAEQTVNITGKPVERITVNGKFVAPLLEFEEGDEAIAVPQFFTRGSSFELPLVLWVFYRVKIKLLKFFFQTNSLELF